MKYIVIFLILSIPGIAIGQDSVKIYNPSADAAAELKAAIKAAGEQNKNVLVQVGGNWCPWCIRLHGFFKSEQQVDSILKADYILVRVNYSPENKNPEVLARLEYPQRFGFPVLLILDGNGKRLHTQDTGLLELGKGYDPEKIKRFLLSWNRAALNPATYSKK
ncbi:MAG TPA: thioredoxin family protein [Bacteroidales bacterium]|jgi:thioredoxin-related protein|nr:thioredoxin family protein [Bacteroidales bacterium]